ncbi:MAG: hypothetical protein ACK556_08565 [Pseudanabaena sp.]
MYLTGDIYREDVGLLGRGLVVCGVVGFTVGVAGFTAGLVVCDVVGFTTDVWDD